VTTLLEIEAVTLPICAVPATSAGREARDTACVAGKFPMVTLLPTVTEPICAVPATNAGSVVKDTGWVA